MELDELRSRWQQTAPDTVAPDTASPAELVARGARNSVATIRLNAWLELSFTVLGLLLSCGALLYVHKLENQVTLIWVIVLCAGSIVSYHRHLLRGLRDLGAADTTVREHVARQLNGLRKVVRSSYQSALWTLPVSLGIGFCFSLSRKLAHYSGRLLLIQLGFLIVGTSIATALAYFMMSRFGHWYLQNLYGQHLDQLEASLRELDEPAEPTASAGPTTIQP